MKRTLIAVCVLALVIGVFVGCSPRIGENSTPPESGDKKAAREKVPESAAKEVFSCLENGDPDKLLSLTLPEKVEKMKKGPEESGVLGDYYFLATVLKEADGKMKFSNMKIYEDTSPDTENTLIVETSVELFLKDQSNKYEWKNSLTFVKSDDKWLLSDVKDFAADQQDTEKSDED